MWTIINNLDEIFDKMCAVRQLDGEIMDNTFVRSISITDMKKHNIERSSENAFQ